MDCGYSITIKDYHNGGGDLTLKLTGIQYSEGTSNSGRIQLIVYRKPDQFSSRLGMFAFLRNTQPGYGTLGFSQVTLKQVQCNEAGAILSMSTNVYFDVAVESAKPYAAEEMLTFVARRKTAEFRIP